MKKVYSLMLTLMFCLTMVNGQVLFQDEDVNWLHETKDTVLVTSDGDPYSLVHDFAINLLYQNTIIGVFAVSDKATYVESIDISDGIADWADGSYPMDYEDRTELINNAFIRNDTLTLVGLKAINSDADILIGAKCKLFVRQYDVLTGAKLLDIDNTDDEESVEIIQAPYIYVGIIEQRGADYVRYAYDRFSRTLLFSEMDVNGHLLSSDTLLLNLPDENYTDVSSNYMLRGDDVSIVQAFQGTVNEDYRKVFFMDINDREKAYERDLSSFIDDKIYKTRLLYNDEDNAIIQLSLFKSATVFKRLLLFLDKSTDQVQRVSDDYLSDNKLATYHIGEDGSPILFLFNDTERALDIVKVSKDGDIEILKRMLYYDDDVFIPRNVFLTDNHFILQGRYKKDASNGYIASALTISLDRASLSKSEDVASSGSARVYPTVSGGEFVIDNQYGDALNYTIINNTSSMVHQGKVVAGMKLHMDLSLFPNGIYYILLHGDHVNEVQRIILQL